MAVYNGILSNFIQGVSTQPRTKRYEGQVAEQINCSSDVLKGLSRRVGSQMLNNRPIIEGMPGSANYTYDRGDDTEKYWINVYNGVLRVTNLNTGVPATVQSIGPTANAYLQSANPSEDIKFCTVADTTFVVNKSKKVTSYGVLTKSPGYQYLIYCKKVSYGATYSVTSPSYTIPHTATYLPPTLAEDPYPPVVLPTSPIGTLAAVQTRSTVVTPTWDTDFTAVDKTVFLRTHLIMESLWTQLQSTLIRPGITGQWEGDVIYITSTSKLDINVSDTNHGTELKMVQTEVDTYDNLPAQAVNGFQVKVTGTDTTEFNDYYLEYETDSGTTFGSGKWKETVGWGIAGSLSWDTMPHELRRISENNFLLTDVHWDAREAGDDETNPMPSFVGSYINDLTTYQSRLVVLSRDNLIASVTSEYYNFFANTVTASSDSDPIDASSNDNQITNLEHAIIFNGALVIFSNQSQFMHPADIAFTTKNLSLAAKSKFTNISNCKPVTAGTSIFFPFKTGESTNIRELTMESLTGNVQARVVTEQAKNYIKGSATRMAADTNNNFLFILCEGDTKILYVYQWYKDGTELKQQAIHSWEFTDTIIDLSVVQGSLYLLQSGQDVVYLSEIALSNPDTYKLDFNLKLDNKYLLTPVSQTPDGAYAMYLPQYYSTAPNFRICNLNDSNAAGVEPLAYERVDNVLYLVIPSGSTINSEYIIGVPYESSCELTTPSIKDGYNRIQSRVRLRLGDFRFSLIDSGYLKVLIYYNSMGEKYKEHAVIFSPDLIGLSKFALETDAELIDYLFKVPIRGDAESTQIILKSDSFLPFNVTDATWSGQYNEKGRRTP